MSLCIPAPDDGSDPPIERMFISVLTVCYVLKDANFTLKHCQNILKIVRKEPLKDLGMITVFVNVMTKESMITVMNQKIS